MALQIVLRDKRNVAAVAFGRGKAQQRAGEFQPLKLLLVLNRCEEPSVPSHSPSRANAAFERVATEIGYGFAGEIKIGGNYAPFVVNGDEVYVSGQIPRVGDRVVVTGRAGADVALPQAQLAAKVCAMRALALLRAAVGGDLDRVKRILRIAVFTQCTDSFTQQSEVSDGASEVLYAVLGAAGVHTRTSVGVYQLPKNATVELDLVAAVE